MCIEMNDFAKIGAFIGVGFILNHLVFWIFRMIER